ncbi:MFS transporter [Mycobacterium sp. 852002-51057_SCH5723018]|uniref:MFS transporter n=1 Tax=Mycobacterium sp. 852002-51057_SCH5723018 TaxID=1834094 RepID=UPI000800EA01|nr:MFS transporter [Mycobacterium sp. 852002-51057_SCH5723018]OBG27572.1 tetracenomycin C resistance and export protein [Mycobacterium sp. 852002-51057_SCH5723018]
MSIASTAPELAELHRHRAASHRGIRGNPWWTLAAVSVGVIMVGLDASVVAIANPRIALDLRASLSDLQWITDAYMLALASLLVFGGKLADGFGRRRAFFIGVIGFAATSVGIGLIGTVGGVITLRAVQGVFGALLMPSTLAIVRATFPPQKLNTAVGIWAGASGVSIAAGPIVGGLLVEHVSWQSVFYINAPIAAVALLIGGLAIVESRSVAGHRLDVPGITTLSGGLFLIVFGLIKAQNWGWLAGRTLGLLLAGLAVLAVFVLIEMRAAEPLLPMRLFANRSLSIGTAVVVIDFFALFGAIFFLSLYLQNVLGFSPVETGVRTLPLSLTLMITAPLSGFLTEKFGPRPAMVVGLAAVAAALFSLGFLHTDSGYQALWPGFVLLGAGIGLVLTASSDAIIGNADVDDAGLAGGLQSTAVQLGGVLGTTILGSVLSSRVGSVLFDQLTGAGVPATVAAKVTAAKELVAQGVSPTVPGMSAPLAHAVAQGSHSAFMVGLHASMVVAAVAAAVGAVLALFVGRGKNSGSS